MTIGNEDEYNIDTHINDQGHVPLKGLVKMCSPGLSSLSCACADHLSSSFKGWLRGVVDLPLWRLGLVLTNWLVCFM